MKKIFNYILIIATVAIITTGCGATKSYVGEAKGYSQNEEVSREISRLNAAAESAVKHSYTVDLTETIETTDTNGEPKSVYTSIKTGTSEVEFSDNQIKTTTRHKQGMYESNSLFTGNAKKRTK